jgi:hypothetical protein
VPAYATVRVRRLWYASNLHYAPAFDKMEGSWRWDYLCPAPAQLLPVVREIARRADAALRAEVTGPARVFLGRRPHQWRRLVNYTAIEAAAGARGFLVVYPEEHDFDSQVELLRHARYVVAPLGSALFLLYFARPGTKLCTLAHTSIDEATSYNGLYEGIDMSVVTGSIVRPDLQFPDRSDYAIDEKRFCEFLDTWLAGDLADTIPTQAAPKDPATASAGGCI